MKTGAKMQKVDEIYYYKWWRFSERNYPRL